MSLDSLFNFQGTFYTIIVSYLQIFASFRAVLGGLALDQHFFDIGQHVRLFASSKMQENFAPINLNDFSKLMIELAITFHFCLFHKYGVLHTTKSASLSGADFSVSHRMSKGMADGGWRPLHRSNVPPPIPVAGRPTL